MCKYIFILVSFIENVNVHSSASATSLIHLKTASPASMCNISVSSANHHHVRICCVLWWMTNISHHNCVYTQWWLFLHQKFCLASLTHSNSTVYGWLSILVWEPVKSTTKAYLSPNWGDHKNEQQWVHWANDLCERMARKVHLHSLQSHLSHFQSWWSWCNINTMVMVEIMWFLAQ